jgi:hypothetical protein
VCLDVPRKKVEMKSDEIGGQRKKRFEVSIVVTDRMRSTGDPSKWLLLRDFP